MLVHEVSPTQCLPSVGHSATGHSVIPTSLMGDEESRWFAQEVTNAEVRPLPLISSVCTGPLWGRLRNDGSIKMSAKRVASSWGRPGPVLARLTRHTLGPHAQRVLNEEPPRECQTTGAGNVGGVGRCLGPPLVPMSRTALGTVRRGTPASGRTRTMPERAFDSQSPKRLRAKPWCRPRGSLPRQVSSASCELRSRGPPRLPFHHRAALRGTPPEPHRARAPFRLVQAAPLPLPASCPYLGRPRHETELLCVEGAILGGLPAPRGFLPSSSKSGSTSRLFHLLQKRSPIRASGWSGSRTAIRPVP